MGPAQAHPSLLILDESSLLAILCCSSHLSHLDILRVGRCCQRLHALCQSDLVWANLYTVVYGPGKPHDTVSWRQMFKDRCVHEAKEQRMKRRIQRFRLQSDINAHHRAVKQMHAQLEHEQQEQKRVSKELRRLQHAKQVQSVPPQLFHLNAVKLYHNQVVQATPVSLAAQLASLQQQQRMSQVEMETLQSGIKSHQQRLRTYTRQLAAMQG